MKTLKEKHSELSNLIGEEKARSKLHNFYNRAILQAKKVEELSHVPLNFESNVQVIINHLNRLTGQDFRWKSKETQASIKARLNEGNTIEDFKHVHEIKTREWLENPQMRQHLNPSTLYRPTNFEKYRNQYKLWKHQKREEEDKKKESIKPKDKKVYKAWHLFDSYSDLYNYIAGFVDDREYKTYKLPVCIEELSKCYITAVIKKSELSKKQIENEFQQLKQLYLDNKKQSQT